MTKLITPLSPTEMGFNDAAQGFFDMNADLREKPKTPSLRLKSVIAESLQPGRAPSTHPRKELNPIAPH